MWLPLESKTNADTKTNAILGSYSDGRHRSPDMWKVKRECGQTGLNAFVKKKKKRKDRKLIQCDG